MMAVDLQATMRDDAWASLCRSTEGQAAAMIGTRSRLVGELAEPVVMQFCKLPAPTNDAELTTRHMQSTAVMRIISSILHADTMASSNPEAASDLYAAAKKLSGRSLPKDGEELTKLMSDSMAYSSKLSAICNDHLMRRV